MSIRIISVDHSLDDKDSFKTKVIEYSDFRSYIEDLKFDDTLVFTPHIDRVEVFYKTATGGMNIHQAWVVTD